MAKSNKPPEGSSKGKFKNRRTENATYKMKCRDCDWESKPGPFRSSQRLEGEQHTRFTKDMKTGKGHRVEMIKVD